MSSPFIRAVLAAAVLLQAGAAVAGTVTLGTTTCSTPGNLGSFAAGSQLAVGDALTNSSSTSTLTFYDDFVFSVGSPVNLTALSTSLQLLPTGMISGLTESLHSGSTTVYQATGTNPEAGTALAGALATGTLSFNALAAGTYTLQLSGVLAKATVVLGKTVPTIASYGTRVSLAPATSVPEPGTSALMALGVAAVAVRVRGRARKA